MFRTCLANFSKENEIIKINYRLNLTKMSFTPLSIELSKSLNLNYKKKNGIFFTPKPIRQKLLVSHPVLENGMTVLEPSMGSGEFILDILESHSEIDIVGVEKSEEIMKKMRLVNYPPRVQLIHDDFLAHDFGETTFNYIIGNPPYFQITENKLEYRKRWPILGGKFDIYILFILKCLELLSDKGVLKLVIPKSFLSTDSYEPIRRLVASEYQILDIIEFSETKEWINTNQKTIGLIIRNEKHPRNDLFQISLNGDCFLHSRQSISTLNRLIKESQGKTVEEMGFSIKTGEIVWNTMKEKLTNDPTKAFLIHNSYLKGSTANLSLDQKGSSSTRPLFIDCNESFYIREPTIVINRGNGNNGNLNVNFAYIDPQSLPYLTVAENHLYKITDNGNNQLPLLYKSLCDPRTNEFIQKCIGSGFITKQFLKRLPVFL